MNSIYSLVSSFFYPPSDRVTESRDTITFANEAPPESAQQRKDNSYSMITVTGMRRYQADLLASIAKHMQAPDTLDLDLFYSFDTQGDLNRYENQIREIFSRWQGKGVSVQLRDDATILRTIVL